VLTRALQELQALPDDAPERRLVYPVLVRLRLAIPPDPIQQTTDQKEFLMTTQDIVETWRQQAIQEGLEKGEKRGLERGAANSLLLFYEARFGAMPDDLRAVIEDTHHLATLHGWIQLIGIRSADEIIAALRAHRAR